MIYIMVLKVTKFREDRLKRFEIFSKPLRGPFCASPQVQIGLSLVSGEVKVLSDWEGKYDITLHLFCSKLKSR